MKITICGSIAFYTDMEEIGRALEAQGHEVKIPELPSDVVEVVGNKKMYFGEYIEKNGGIDAFSPSHPLWDIKAKAIKEHYDKIEWCDAIVVVNNKKRGVEGYVGGNTLIEIGLAFYLKKPIYLLNPMSSELSYKQEVLGMKPVLLNGDVSLVQ